MKTITSSTPITGSSHTRRSRARIARVVVACIFATGVAMSDTLHSTVQYGIELEKKQDSLTTIKEDTRSIEDAFKRKVFDEKSGGERPGIGALPGQDIAALIPPAPRLAFPAHAVPCGTLTPRGTTGVVDRGFKDSKK